MPYLSYYSRMRNTFGGDLKAMVAAEKNKIVTKIIPESNWNRDRRSHIATVARMLHHTLAIYAGDEYMYGHYTRFQIPKASGGHRIIDAPSPQLKEVQQKLVKYIVEDCHVLCHNAAHSFVKHRNCKTALEAHQHANARWFLKTDIKDFFSSCTEDRLVEALCAVHPLCLIPHSTLRKMVHCCTLDGVLPQGAPTSPILSNLYMLEFDYLFTLTLQSIDERFTYTRYADDILISSPVSFDRNQILGYLQHMLPKGLSLSAHKTRYGSCNGSNWNLGLMYNKDHAVTVGYRQKHKIKNKIHNLYSEPYNTYAKDSPEFSRWFASVVSLKALIGYYKFIEPVYFTTLIEKYKAKGIEL